MTGVGGIGYLLLVAQGKFYYINQNKFKSIELKSLCLYNIGLKPYVGVNLREYMPICRLA